MAPQNEKERRVRKGNPGRKAVSEAQRAILKEAIAETMAHAGIDDGDQHKADHAMLRQFAPLLADLQSLLKSLREVVIPYVEQQRQIALDKQTDNREVFRELKTWAYKAAIAMGIMALFGGGLKAAWAHFPEIFGG